MKMRTAESVAIGHPDKICDQISDAILDECLKQDPDTRCAIETMGGHGKIFITGELTTKAKINIEEIARDIYDDCGYGNDEISVQTNVEEQSPEIAKGVDNEGAGDQGIMVGYACDETDELMPREVVFARSLTKAMGAVDGKSQVTMDDNRIDTIITSVCGGYSEEVEKLLKSFDANRILKNPNGEWTVGGFNADAGLTGRKLIVDNYGPRIPIGGGAFSGKDATKVDRSGAYMARKVAVDYLRERNAKEVYAFLAYAIGKADPVQATVIIDGKEEKIEGYDLTPKGIIEFLDLKKPQFRETAKYGHFGNGFKWD